ncbi:hypothetical protein L596_001083 [Steinernema carpocapsae]|uniref:Uncharacterized protein n=1 Tax=Steinernema carpocapsae TaxID=34508 RepID=A0A4U8UK86_STECR|nr:hypothetical protein L596_001083 [Steinernema carpocapsae]
MPANHLVEAEKLKGCALLSTDHLRKIYPIVNCRSFLNAVFACNFDARCSGIRTLFIELKRFLYKAIQQCLVNLVDLLLDGFQFRILQLLCFVSPTEDDDLLRQERTPRDF